MQADRTTDPTGGPQVQWTEGEAFLAGMTDGSGSLERNGGLTTLKTRVQLLHEPGVRLLPGEQVKRVRDGLLLRVLGDSDDQRTPVCAGMPYACVPVEKAVDAP